MDAAWAQQAHAILGSGSLSAEKFFELATGDAATGSGAQLKMLLGYMQRLPRTQQDPIWNELAAKYLPQLVEKWRADNSGPLTPTTRIINVISYTPYFIRFLGIPAGQGIAALYTHRLALSSSSLTDVSDADTIAECSQFLATLLLVQGITDVDAQDKQTLLPALRAWVHKPAFRGRLASDASERVVWILTGDRSMASQLAMVRTSLQAPLERCSGPGCSKTRTNAELQKCSKCKTALFCSKEHQKLAWSVHKKTCFEPSF